MCLYQIRFCKPIKEFYCAKLKDTFLACPPACPFYVKHNTSNIEDHSQELSCLNLDFLKIDRNKIPICLVDCTNFPDCSSCPPEKKNIIYLPVNKQIMNEEKV